LKEKVTLLNINRKPVEVYGILMGFLKHHSKDAEPWMYEALALSIRITGGDRNSIKTALGYAADIAERDKNPNNLVSVADLLFFYGFYDRVGRLLDEAATKVPHRNIPLIMSINLAQRTKDPKRMAASIDQLLSLGWPGDDERIRRDCRSQAEMLAKALREDGRNAEADKLLASLPAAESRDLYIRLQWDKNSNAGLDLSVEEPLGATACFTTPRTVFGGAIVEDGHGKHPRDVYVCPRAFDGDYKVSIQTSYNDPEKPALHATLEIITHENSPAEHRETRTISLGSKGIPPVVVRVAGGRRTAVLPFLSPSAIVEDALKARERGRPAGKPKKKEQAAKRASKPEDLIPIGQGDVKARPR
jgi:hypothetical protein